MEPQAGRRPATPRLSTEGIVLPSPGRFALMTVAGIVLGYISGLIVGFAYFVVLYYSLNLYQGSRLTGDAERLTLDFGSAIVAATIGLTVGGFQVKAPPPRWSLSWVLLSGVVWGLLFLLATAFWPRQALLWLPWEPGIAPVFVTASLLSLGAGLLVLRLRPTWRHNQDGVVGSRQ
jgi:hypothetical protein